MGKLKEWALDWVDCSDTLSSDRKISDPLAIVQSVFATLAAVVALASSPVINAFAPNLNSTARLGLNVLIALLTLAAVHYVVTAKDMTESLSGHRVQSRRTYRFSQLERWVGRGVVALAIILLALNRVASVPPACGMTATVTWPSSAASRALYLAVTAGGREQRYDVETGKPVALEVVPAHASDFSIALLWSDGARSDFGGFSACPAAINRTSNDGRARIDIAGR
jgi:hypothetical protein